MSQLINAGAIGPFVPDGRSALFLRLHCTALPASIPARLRTTAAEVAAAVTAELASGWLTATDGDEFAEACWRTTGRLHRGDPWSGPLPRDQHDLVAALALRSLLGPLVQVPAPRAEARHAELSEVLDMVSVQRSGQEGAASCGNCAEPPSEERSAPGIPCCTCPAEDRTARA